MLQLNFMSLVPHGRQPFSIRCVRFMFWPSRDNTIPTIECVQKTATIWLSGQDFAGMSFEVTEEPDGP